MTYDTLTATSFAATSFIRTYAPRLIELGYALTLFTAAGTLWLMCEAIESGRQFNDQFNEGYGLEVAQVQFVEPVVESVIELVMEPLIEQIDEPVVETIQSNNLSGLGIRELRKMATDNGIKNGGHMKKAQLIELLS